MSDNKVTEPLERIKLPEVMVFAGPNGSGKTTIKRMVRTVGDYINADDIKRTTLCSDLEAAQKAEELREKMIEERRDFSFETVLSTQRNLLLLRKAKAQGYFVRGIYVLTANADINVARVSARQALGGHGVPEDKIRARYSKALDLIPKLVEVCDILHIYDNTVEPFRIFKKREDICFRWSNDFWDDQAIKKLVGISDFGV